MFQEIDQDLLKPPADFHRKYWFRENELPCDVFIWVDENEKIRQFQVWQCESLVEWSSESGVRTGLLENDAGAFIHYQTELYRFHLRPDSTILNIAKDIFSAHIEPGQRLLVRIEKILVDNFK